MARFGDELINPVTGLRTVFRKTAKDTGGELLQVDWIGSPGWTTGPDHVQPPTGGAFRGPLRQAGPARGWHRACPRRGRDAHRPGQRRARGLERGRRHGVCPSGFQAGLADRGRLRDVCGAGARREDRRGGSPPGTR